MIWEAFPPCLAGGEDAASCYSVSPSLASKLARFSFLANPEGPGRFATYQY